MPGPLRPRDMLVGAVSTVAVWGLYGFPGLVLVAADLAERMGWFEPADIERPATYDPDGMDEGEGDEDAPDDAIPGVPEAVLDAPTEETEQEVAGDPPPPAEVEAEPTEEPAVAEVVLVDDVAPGPDPSEPPPPAEEAPTEPTPTDPTDPTEPTSPRRPSSSTGAPSTRPSTTPSSPPSGTPGVDPTKVKDVGDKASAVNKDAGCSEPHPQITQIDPTHWRVEKDLVEYYTSSIPIFNTLGYSKKYDENGEKGWLIGGFGCKGPLYKAGLRSKDVIQEVNGKKTNTVAQIIGLWLFSKKKGLFEVKLLRKGKPMTLYYDVIP